MIPRVIDSKHYDSSSSDGNWEDSLGKTEIIFKLIMPDKNNICTIEID